jgi:hypothetical protein
LEFLIILTLPDCSDRNSSVFLAVRAMADVSDFSGSVTFRRFLFSDLAFYFAGGYTIIPMSPQFRAPGTQQLFALFRLSWPFRFFRASFPANTRKARYFLGSWKISL